MGRSILIALMALLVTPAAASACATIPAGFADDVRPGSRTHHGERTTRQVTSLCAVAGGRRAVLRSAELATPKQAPSERRRRPRGVLIGGAAAAGRRVAWIETHFPSGRASRAGTRRWP